MFFGGISFIHQTNHVPKFFDWWRAIGARQLVKKTIGEMDYWYNFFIQKYCYIVIQNWHSKTEKKFKHTLGLDLGLLGFGFDLCFGLGLQRKVPKCK